MEIIEKGQCGERVFYELTNNGILTIYGTGDMYDYFIVNRSPFCHCKNIKTVFIENGVTSIGQRVFHGCSLKSITIPSSLTNIKHAAFYFCQSLTTINIPNTLIKIENFAFSSCTSLVSITLPKSIDFIGTGIFQWTPRLTSITILNPTPPLTGELRAFYDNCILKVPIGSKQAYTNHEVWGKFKAIEELEIQDLSNKITTQNLYAKENE